mgnify:CR=1 FL=1
MSTKTILLAAASFAVLSTPAMAQDNDAFTGLRVEGVGGFDTTSAGSSVDDEVNEDNDQSIEGFVYGAAVGYDVNVGGVVLGAEAELTDSTARTEIDAGDFEGFGFGNVETGRDIYVGARVGVVAAENTLVYAKGGYSNARYNIESSFDGDEYRSFVDADGYRIGAGIEQRLGANAYAKLEYRYSNYSDAEVDFDDNDVPEVAPSEIDTDRHQVMAGVGWRF